MRKLWSAALATALVFTGGFLWAWPAFAEAYETSCVAALATHPWSDPETVHTNRWELTEDLEDLGSYQDIHWQVSSPRNPGPRYPVATDCSYQLILRLPPVVAQKAFRDIRAKWRNTRSDRTDSLRGASPPTILPSLRKFVPAKPEWVYDYGIVSGRNRQLFLDADHAVALVNFTAED